MKLKFFEIELKRILPGAPHSFWPESANARGTDSISRNSTYAMPLNRLVLLQTINLTSVTLPTAVKKSSTSLALTVCFSCIQKTVRASLSSGVSSGSLLPLRTFLMWNSLLPMAAFSTFLCSSARVSRRSTLPLLRLLLLLRLLDLLLLRLPLRFRLLRSSRLPRLSRLLLRLLSLLPLFLLFLSLLPLRLRCDLLRSRDLLRLPRLLLRFLSLDSLSSFAFSSFSSFTHFPPASFSFT